MSLTNVFSMISILLVIHRVLAGINIIRTPQFGVLNFKKIDGYYLNVSRGVSTEVAHFPACANECRRNKTCSTFNLEKKGEKTYCEVLQDDYCTNQDKLVADSSRQVFYVESKCCSDGCLNGGTCSMSYNKVRQLCSCAQSYGGERCEKQVSKQYCYLFSERDKLGDTGYVNEASQTLSTLDNRNLNDKTKSLSCFGIWLLYPAAFVQYTNNLLVESKGETLTNLEAGPLYGAMSAIRPVGPLIDPFSKDWLVLYSRPQYFGDELLIENDLVINDVLPKMQDNAESAMMYGTSSWTLFNGMSYNAESVCLKGRSDGKRKEYWTFTTFNLANKVSSVKKGCHSATIV